MTVGIICEYNPLHLGHKKQMDLIRREFGGKQKNPSDNHHCAKNSDQYAPCFLTHEAFSPGLPLRFQYGSFCSFLRFKGKKDCKKANVPCNSGENRTTLDIRFATLL